MNGKLLAQGRWTGENRKALENLLNKNFKEPPIAVFDWDYTCIYGDTADMVFHALCRDLAFKFDAPDFVAWVEELPLPTQILECVELFWARPSAETRAALGFELERTRWALHQSEDDNQAWAWDAGAFVGWQPIAVREYTRRVIARELAQPLREIQLTHPTGARSGEFGEAVRDGDLQDLDYIERARRMRALDPDADLTLTLQRGLRVRSEIRELMAELRRAGWQIYIITASPQWEIEAFAERYFVPPQNVIGMRRRIEAGVITAEIEPPISWGDGKQDAYNLFVSRERPPRFVVGDSVGDWKLLEWATDCALLVEPPNIFRGDSALRDYALWKRSLGDNWLIQEFAEQS